MDNHEIVRAMIKSENELINQRMSWVSAFNGFLFAATAFAWDKSSVLVAVLAILGIAVSLLSGAALLAANSAFRGLYAWWQENKPADYTGPDVIGLPPRYSGKPGRWLNFWSVIPVLFACAWVIIAITRLLS
jgi:hypothetical protein